MVPTNCLAKPLRVGTYFIIDGESPTVATAADTTSSISASVSSSSSASTGSLCFRWRCRPWPCRACPKVMGCSASVAPMSIVRLMGTRLPMVSLSWRELERGWPEDAGETGEFGRALGQ